MKAKKFDSDFDSGKDITQSLDLSNVRRPLQEQKRVNVDYSYLDDRISCKRSINPIYFFRK